MAEDAIKSTYTGSFIHTNYGAKKRTYKILEIMVKMTPKSEFHNKKKGEAQTYEEYYRESYGIKVTNTKQPLLRVLGKYEIEMKDGKS